MRKIDAVAKILQNNGGVATRKMIYDNFPTYYGPIDPDSPTEQAGIRGVVYREMKDGKMFKNVGLGQIGLIDTKEEKIDIGLFDKLEDIEEETKESKVKIHTYIESILIDMGNYQEFKTYCPDKSYEYRQGLKIGDITTVNQIPDFTYPNIVSIAKQIDVLRFCNELSLFPKKAFEVVDSIGTLATSLNRLINLEHFDSEYIVLAPEKYKNKFEQTMASKPYNTFTKNIKFNTYSELEGAYLQMIEMRDKKKILSF